MRQCFDGCRVGRHDAGKGVNRTETFELIELDVTTARIAPDIERVVTLGSGGRDREPALRTENHPVHIHIERRNAGPRRSGSWNMIRNVPGGIRVVRPDRIRGAADRGDARVVAEVSGIAGQPAGQGIRPVFVRRTIAHPDVCRPGLATVQAHRGEILDLGVPLPIGINVSCGRRVDVVPGIVPGDEDGTGHRVHAYRLEELTVAHRVARVVVHANTVAPMSAVIIRKPDEDVEVVAFVDDLIRINEIQPPAERTDAPVIFDKRAGESASVPILTRRNDGRTGCGRNIIKPTRPAGGGENVRTEDQSVSQPVQITIDEHADRPFATGRSLPGNQDGACRAD